MESKAPHFLKVSGNWPVLGRSKYGSSTGTPRAHEGLLTQGLPCPSAITRCKLAPGLWLYPHLLSLKDQLGGSRKHTRWLPNTAWSCFVCKVSAQNRCHWLLSGQIGTEMSMETGLERSRLPCALGAAREAGHKYLSPCSRNHALPGLRKSLCTESEYSNFVYRLISL